MSVAPQVFRTPTQVIAFFAQQIRANPNPRLGGLEEEIIILDRYGKPLSHRHFQTVLSALMQALPQGHVMPGMAIDGMVIPALRGECQLGWVQPETNTTLIEFAHRPTSDSHQTQMQSLRFSIALAEVAAAQGLYIVGAGAVPSMEWADFSRNDVVIPNADYSYSHTNMRNGQRLEYCRTVFGTASVHHNMGFNDPELMARYIRAALRLQPTMIALTGNSPLWDNEAGDALSRRSEWQLAYGSLYGIDGASYLYPDFLLDPAADFAAMVQGYLAQPLDRTIVNGRKRFCSNVTMLDYLREGLEQDGQRYYPDAAALTMMLREPIVDIRPSMTGSAPRVEARAHDCVSQTTAVAIDACYRGVLANLDAVENLLNKLSPAEIRRQRLIVCSRGLQTDLDLPHHPTQRHLAQTVLELAEVGLQQRGLGENDFLAPLWQSAITGQNPAQRLLARWNFSDVPASLAGLNYLLPTYYFPEGGSVCAP